MYVVNSKLLIVYNYKSYCMFMTICFLNVNLINETISIKYHILNNSANYEKYHLKFYKCQTIFKI